MNAPQTPNRPPLSGTFFNPRAMAFIGATADRKKIRGMLFHFATLTGYSGKLFPIHPREDQIDGHKVYRSILDVPDPVDLAIICIPAPQVPASVEECARAGVGNVIIISSGFAEEGSETAEALQDQLREIAERTGIRISGPNAEGFYNAVDNVSATFSPVIEALPEDTMPDAAPDRRIGVISQSGGMGFAMFTRGRALGLSFSHVVSTGNEMDLTTADYLDCMVRDPATKIIMILCEGLRDGPGFMRAAAAAREAGKPVVMVKLGRSSAGARAAASHTASLSGEHSAYRAVFRRYGIIEAQEMDEAVAIAAAFAVCPLPRGRRVGVVTASGGGGTTGADVFSDYGLTVPELSDAVQARILPKIPPHASALNPVDITAQGASTGPVLLHCAEVLDECDEIDMVQLVISAARETSVSLVPEAIRRIVDRARTPLLIYCYTLPSNLARRVAAENGSVLMDDIRHCAAGLRALADYAQVLASPISDAVAATPKMHRRDTDVIPTEYRCRKILSDYGLGGEDDRLVTTAEEAASAAAEIGGPVVLKISSPGILHKTDAGGVRLGLTGEEAVRAAFDDIIRNAQAFDPNAQIEGVLVQPMAPKGIEIVVGMVNDPTFGPIMMLGAGGTGVELFGDVIHYPAPFSPARAEALLQQLKSAPLFNGFRGSAPVDLAKISGLISRLSQAAIAGSDWIAEMEFNPIILHPDGSFTVADAVLIPL